MAGNENKPSEHKTSSCKTGTKHCCKHSSSQPKIHVASSSQKSPSSSRATSGRNAPSWWLDYPKEEALRESFLYEINRIRHSLSLSKVTLHPLLNRCAAEHNYDQAYIMNAIRHGGSDGSTTDVRLKRLGYRYRWCGENVAHGQKTVKWAVDSLMKSPGHRKNIVSERAVEMGIHGGVGKDGKWYWTQILAARKDA